MNDFVRDAAEAMDVLSSVGVYIWKKFWGQLSYAGEALKPFNGVLLFRRLLGAVSLVGVILLFLSVLYNGFGCYPRRNTWIVIWLCVAAIASWGA